MLVEGGFCESASLGGFEYLKGRRILLFCLCVAESRADLHFACEILRNCGIAGCLKSVR